MIFIALLIAALFFFGLIGAAICIAGGVTWLLMKTNAWAGLGFAVLALAAFILPGAMDQSVLERQNQVLEAQEYSVPPIDMTGRSILFLGSSPYAPSGCSDLCRAVVEYGAADHVYFGYDRSLDLQFRGEPVDLSGREIHEFPPSFPRGLPADALSVPVTPERVDFIVLQGSSFDFETRAALSPNIPTIGGLYRLHTYWEDIFIYEAGDLTQFNPATQTPLVTRFEFTRGTYGFISLPWFPTGDPDFDHNYRNSVRDRASANARDAADVLCGPIEQPNYDTCAVVLD